MYKKQLHICTYTFFFFTLYASYLQNSTYWWYNQKKIFSNFGTEKKNKALTFIYIGTYILLCVDTEHICS